MKNDKTIGDAVSGAASAVKNAVVSTKDIKLSSIKKLIINVWKLALLVFMFGMVASFISIYNHEHGRNEGLYMSATFGIVAFIEFYFGIITSFIFKDRS